MSKAKEAKEKTEQAQEFEKVQMATIQAIAVSNLGVINPNDNSLETLRNGLAGVVENASSISGEGPWAVIGKAGENKKKYTIKSNGDITQTDANEVALTGIEVSPLEVNLEIGGTQAITVTPKPNDATEGVEFRSNNESVATVSEAGVITGVSAGSATITVRGKTTQNENTTKTINVTVNPNVVALTGINLESNSVSILVEGTAQINATLVPANTTESLTYTSSNPSVASVSNTGLVTGVAASSEPVTITIAGSTSTGVTATFTVIVSNPAPTIATSSTHDKTSANNYLKKAYTWEKLSELADIISNNEGTGTNQINNDTMEVTITQNGTPYVLGIGDTATVTYSGTAKTVRIIGFNHDWLASNTGSETKKAGITFDFENCMVDSAKMNSSDTNSGGWNSCALKSTLNGTYLNNLKDNNNTNNMSTYIKTVKKEYIPNYSTASTSWTTDDKLWLLSCGEIWNTGNTGYSGTNPRGYAITKEGDQYKYYKNINATCNSGNNNLIKKNSNNSAVSWWLRSPLYSNGSSFCGVYYTDGQSTFYDASFSGGVSPGFAI